VVAKAAYLLRRDLAARSLAALRESAELKPINHSS